MNDLSAKKSSLALDSSEPQSTTSSAKAPSPRSSPLKGKAKARANEVSRVQQDGDDPAASSAASADEGEDEVDLSEDELEDGGAVASKMLVACASPNI